jgi:hypothetical protein
MPSRSRIMKRGASSNGNASTICWPVQRAVGCRVTLKCTTRRRSCRSTNEAIKQLKTHSRHNEEVDGGDVVDVVLEERTPRLRRRLAMTDHVLPHRRFIHVVTEQLQFRVDPWRAPRGVLTAHAPKTADLADLRPPGLAATSSANRA